MAEDGEVIAELARYVEYKIKSAYGFVPLAVPELEDLSDQPQTSILASSGWQTAERLLILINNQSNSLIGVLSRSACLDQGLSKGTLFPYIDRALAAGYAVLILRPNTGFIQVEAPGGSGVKKVPIVGSESPEIHTLNVWENIVPKNERVKHIALLGFGNGGSLCREILVQQMVASKRDPANVNKIRALVTLEASHIVDADDPGDIKRALSLMAINFECTPAAPRGYDLVYKNEKLGCRSISLSTPEAGRSKYEVSLDPIFKYLQVSERGGQVGNTFFDAFARENRLNPAAARLTVNPDAEDEPPPPPPTSSPQAAAAPPPKQGLISRLSSRFMGMRSGSMTAAAAPAEDDGSKLTIDDFDLLKIVGRGAFGKVTIST